jgi:hypothetical protein
MRERKAGKLTDDECNAALFALMAMPIERKAEEPERETP